MTRSTRLRLQAAGIDRLGIHRGIRLMWMIRMTLAVLWGRRDTRPIFSRGHRLVVVGSSGASRLGRPRASLLTTLLLTSA